MTRKLVIGNWKMNPRSLKQAQDLFQKHAHTVKKLTKTQVVLCPSYVHVAKCASLKGAPRLNVGAQDVFFEPEGSFTGEVSVNMLKDVGVTHVILGHSERRARGETSDIVQRKVYAVVSRGLTAVVCIGEEARDASGAYYDELHDQIASSLEGVEVKQFKRIIVAYEPVWAIGASADEAMDGDRMHEMGIFIRKVITDTWGRTAADAVRILYGGSVDDTNIEDIIERGHIDGVLVGRASRDVKVFGRMCEIADNLS